MGETIINKWGLLLFIIGVVGVATFRESWSLDFWLPAILGGVGGVMYLHKPNGG